MPKAIEAQHTYQAALTLRSRNSKTGPIPVSTTSRNTCPIAWRQQAQSGRRCTTRGLTPSRRAYGRAH